MKEQTPEEQAKSLIKFYGKKEAVSVALRTLNEAEKEVDFWNNVLSKLK